MSSDAEKPAPPAPAPSEEAPVGLRITSPSGYDPLHPPEARKPAVADRPQMFGAAGALHALSQLQPGAVVADRFVIEALADWGGMGAVYRARDRQTGSVVAVKVMLDTSPDERFAREARILMELQHPRIVGYVAHGRIDSGAPFLAMEWLEGHSLRHAMSKGSVSLRDSIALARGVAEALAAAHARSVVHRDINPRNVFLPGGRFDLPKVLDFGIARPGNATWAITLPGSQLGTPGYMSPEQARGDAAIDARSDVFALGCVLFECIAGRPAFAGDHWMALLSRVLLEEVPRLSTLRNVPSALEDLVSSMLCKRVDGRPAGGAEVLAALDALPDITSDEPRESEPAPASIGQIEQRLVSVVMLGPSSARASANTSGTLASDVRDAPETTMRTRLQRFGAKTEWLADGAIVATLTGDADATDHAAQAARFALALRDEVPHEPIVLATGRGVVTGRTLVGEVLDRAARMLETALRDASDANGAAPTSTRSRPIRIDEITSGLLDLRFEVADESRGRELRGTRDAGDSARTVLGRSTSCVGRDRDLAMLEGTFAEAAGDSVARVILVTAPAGFGKSRLRRELLRRIRRRGEPFELLFGRADPMSAGAPFAMLAMAVRGACGMIDGEPLSTRRGKILARVAKRVPEADRTRVAEFLGELVGAQFPDEGSVQLQAARRDPMLRGDQMRRAWEDFIRAECAHAPVLIVLEDLQWGDLPTIKALDATLRNLASSPLMVLACARPDVHEAFPSVFQQRGVVELRLSELTKKAAERLVREVLGDDVSEQVLRRIVESASGNPFCIEELVRAEHEGRGAEGVPGTVLATAQARIGRFGSRARRILRAASIFGDTFWRRGVHALLGGDALAQEANEWLRWLVDREVLTARGRTKFPGEDELAFEHPLLREAAYAMLTPEDRALGHRLAATWLEAAGEADALTLAQHYERGGSPVGAAAFYLRAAEQALEGGDLDAVIARAERGVAQGASGEPLGALRLLQAEAHKWRGENAAAAEAARIAMELLPRATGAWCIAAAEVAVACGKLGRRDELSSIAEMLASEPIALDDRDAQVIAMARTATQLVLTGQMDLAARLLARLGAAGDASASHPAVAAWVLEARAVSAGAGEDPSARVRLAEAAADAFEHAGDLRNACLQRVSVGYALVEIGDHRAAARALQDAIAVGERMGLDNSIAVARAQLGRARARLGDRDEGCATLRGAIEQLAAHKNVRLEGIARSYLATLLLEAGDVAAAEQEASRATETLTIAPALRGHALTNLARVRLAQRRPLEALAIAQEAIGIVEALGRAAIAESTVRLVHAEALAASGDRPGADAAIALAKTRLHSRAAKIADPDLRACFLARRENASIEAWRYE